MAFADQMAYDAGAVLFNAADFGELADYQAPGVPAVSVRVLWGRVEKQDAGSGYMADASLVHALAEDLDNFRGSIVPERGATNYLVRYPSSLATRERWVVADVSRLDATVWALQVWRLPEAVVTGGG